MTESVTPFQKIATALIIEADYIHKHATTLHKTYLGGDVFRTEILETYKRFHRKFIREIAEHFQDPVIVLSDSFKLFAQELVRNALKDGLTLKEAMDGNIFLKQAIFHCLHEKGLLASLTSEEVYHLSQSIGMYCDVVASEIAFVYNDDLVHKLKVANQKLEKILKSTQTELHTTNRELEKSSEQNEKYGRLVIGRELKMAELKNEIERLKDNQK